MYPRVREKKFDSLHSNYDCTDGHPEKLQSLEEAE